MSFGTLTIQHVDGRRETLSIDKPTVRIGRDRSNDVVLNDQDVSGVHAELLADPTGCQIIDLGSANGTEVDGQRILSQYPQPLSDGSAIRIGGARLVISLSAAQTQPKPAPVSGPASNLLLEDLLAQQPAGRARQETQPLPVAPPPPPALLAVAVRPNELRVDPGKSASAMVELVNRGTVEEQISLSVAGVPEWAAVLPPELTLPPGGRGEAQLLFNPPKTAESRAGAYSYELVARPTRVVDARFAAGGQLVVAPFTEFRFELLDPRAYTGWTGGRYQAQIRNSGNLAMPFTLTGYDEPNAFRFRFRPEPLLVGPGETRRSRIGARLRFHKLFGRPQTYAFTVAAAPGDDSAPAQQASARLVQRPPLPPALLQTLAVLLAAALLFGLLYLLVPPAWAAISPLFRPRSSELAGASTPTASPSPSPTIELPPTPPLPTIEAVLPTPLIIVPTVVIVQPPAAPAPQPQPIIVQLPTVPAQTTPAPDPPDQSVAFAKLGGNDVGGRTPLRGDEFIGQQMAFCVYREIPLPAPPGPGPQPNDPPAVVEGLSLAVNDQPDPATTGAPINISVTIANSVAERRFYGLAATLRPPAGATLSAPSEPRCQPQADGTLLCNLADLGTDNSETLTVGLTATQPGPNGTQVDLTALVGDSADAPARALTLSARATTEFVAPPPPLADCGLPNVAALQESLGLRNPQSFLLQVPPVLYPPPAGILQLPVHALTADAGPEQFVGDALAAITFQRPVSEVTVTIYFPGPTGNFLKLYGVDEQGKLIGIFRTDQLLVPGLYQLTLRGVERPIRLAFVQNAPAEGPGPVAVSGGGVFITKVEIRY